MAAPIRIGTCSFADEALSKHWYPPGTAAKERLPYYAERFSTVEIDSTYYSIPDEKTVEGWAERTPEDFVIHIKAFGVLTRHPVKLEQLPPDLRENMPVDERGRVDRPPREQRARVFRRFHETLEPLRTAGKLGGILFQLPPFVVFRPSSFEYLEWAQAELRGDLMLVEFRHRSWLEDENRAETLRFLEERGMAYVTVDAPKTEAKNLIPTVVAATAPVSYVRFHGRNASTWNARGGGASTRFDWMYSADELREWVGPLRELSNQSEEAYAFFNNNNQNDGVAQAPAGAQLLRKLLEVEHVPVK